MKILTILLALVAAGPALANVCFNKRFINGFQAKNVREVIVYDNRHDYKVQVLPCYDLVRAERIWFETPADFSETCAGDKLLVLNYSNHVTERCQIVKITKIN